MGRAALVGVGVECGSGRGEEEKSIVGPFKAERSGWVWLERSGWVWEVLSDLRPWE